MMQQSEWTRRAFLRMDGVSAATVVLGGAGAPAGEGSQARANPFAAPGRGRPNVLLLLTDDQAFGTVHALNNPEVKTPNMDRLVRTERCKFIRYPQVNEVQLFDLQNDPWETKDLAEDPRYADTVRKLDEQLRR